MNMWVCANLALMSIEDHSIASSGDCELNEARRDMTPTRIKWNSGLSVKLSIAYTQRTGIANLKFWVGILQSTHSYARARLPGLDILNSVDWMRISAAIFSLWRIFAKPYLTLTLAKSTYENIEFAKYWIKFSNTKLLTPMTISSLVKFWVFGHTWYKWEVIIDNHRHGYHKLQYFAVFYHQATRQVNDFLQLWLWLE